MRISGNMSPNQLDMEIGVALQKKAQDQAQVEGAEVVDMITEAGVNQPLSEGPVGRTINVGI